MRQGHGAVAGGRVMGAQGVPLQQPVADRQCSGTGGGKEAPHAVHQGGTGPGALGVGGSGHGEAAGGEMCAGTIGEAMPLARPYRPPQLRKRPSGASSVGSGATCESAAGPAPAGATHTADAQSEPGTEGELERANKHTRLLVAGMSQPGPGAMQGTDGPRVSGASLTRLGPRRGFKPPLVIRPQQQ